jgi:hypothetical protein
MRRVSTLATALRISLSRPALWPLGLGTFLLRGGFLLVLLPIVVVPTPVGIGNLLAPSLMEISLGAIPMGFLVASVALGAGVVLWLGLAGWLAAMLEAGAVRLVAGRGADDVPSRREGGRILACRLICLVPLAVALALGSVRLVFVTYQELTLPSDSATPVAIRVLRDAPDVPIAILVIWMSAEIVAAVAARRIVLGDERVRAALPSAIGSIARRPLAALAHFWLPTIALAAIVLAAALASSAAWTAVRTGLEAGQDPIGAVIATVALVATWLAGLALIGLASAWRAAVWTVAAHLQAGTFGGSTDRRPGDWRPDRRSATL